MSFEGQQLGRYRLQQQLGSGGMGEVYLATDTHIHRQVAVKIIREGATAYPNEEATREAARLFQREMRAVATLDHPNILPLYDYGEETAGRTTLTYMVMPYRKEGSLADWLQQRGKRELLSLPEVRRLVRQAASALQQAHSHNIIHQDVKPSNFLIHITEDEPDRPNLQLADFGVAKFTSATSSMSHAIRGTPSYMAPEQWEGAPVPATDQYALAIMAYELLTGRPPFQGGMGQMMYQHFNVQPQPPSSLNPSIPADLDSVLLHALAKKPEQRFASIAAFSRAFQEAARITNTGTSTSTIMKTPPVQPSSPLTPRLPPTPPPPSPVRGNDLHATLAISPEEALNGTTRTSPCQEADAPLFPYRQRHITDRPSISQVTASHPQPESVKQVRSSSPLPSKTKKSAGQCSTHHIKPKPEPTYPLHLTRTPNHLLLPSELPDQHLWNNVKIPHRHNAGLSLENGQLRLLG